MLDFSELLQNSIDETYHIYDLVLEDVEKLNHISNVLIQAVKRGKKIIFMGNGGSAADSQHLAAELVGSLTIKNRPPIPAIAITTDTSILTAISNDVSYECVFSNQVSAIGNSGDVLVGFSTSGKSKNIHKAFFKAKDAGIRTMLFTNSKITWDYVDHVYNIPSDDTQKIQETYMMIWHVICEYIERTLYEESSVS